MHRFTLTCLTALALLAPSAALALRCEAQTASALPTFFLSTDKACYRPGEPVQLTYTGKLPASPVFIRYRHGATILQMVAWRDVARSGRWMWRPPCGRLPRLPRGAIHPAGRA